MRHHSTTGSNAVQNITRHTDGDQRQKQLTGFIKQRKHLIWYVKDYDALDEDAIVEATLNYGNWDDVKLLFSILGVKHVAEIFRTQTTNRKWGRTNYRQDITRYFNLYFNKHAT